MISQSPAVKPWQARLTVEDITTEDALIRLGPEWQALSERSSGALLFNSYEWVSACWKHFHRGSAPGHDVALRVLAVREAGALRAVAPLWTRTRRLLGVRTRIARFLGEGPSDYGDFLLEAPRRALLETLVAHIGSQPDFCDLLDLREFCAHSPNLPDIRDVLDEQGWQTRLTPDSRCYTISTDGGWEQYCRTRFSAKRRKDLRREWRNLQGAGAFDMVMLRQISDIHAVAEAFGDVQAAHVAVGERRPGEFNDPSFRPFLEEVLSVASARGWLRLAVLRRHGTPAAYWLAFLYRGRYFVYNTAHRSETRRYGAGKLPMLYMLEQFFAENGGTIDYLRGAEPYKEIWTERTVVNVRLRAARPGLRALIGRLVWFDLMPWLERRIPLVHRALVVASEKGIAALVARTWRRLVRSG